MRNTPCYVFDTDAFAARIGAVRERLGDLPLTFSVKANPFLAAAAAERADHLEVCSPGELALCLRAGVPPEKIIYSGVVKEAEDLGRALDAGAGIVTAESLRHAELIQAAARERNITVRALLRLSAGSQFGMSEEDLSEILSRPERYPNVRWTGLHYYSGTQKKKPEQIRRDLEHLDRVIRVLRETGGFRPELVEYGPGLAADVFGADPEGADMALLDGCAELLRAFPFPLGIEMGRFLAAPCGSYHTRVADLKTVNGTRYALLDGGIHQLKYYGQVMALHVPPIVQNPCREGEKLSFCLCGALCTTADVLAREASLAPLEIGDELTFLRCGAYSATEAPGLFLSRDFPEIRIIRRGEETLLRGAMPSWTLITG